MNKGIERELELVEAAIDNEEGRDELKNYFQPLIRSILSKYTEETSPEAEEAAWKHLDFAMSKYMELVDKDFEGKTPFLFSTYFTWYVRQGIVEYLKEK